jgi:hypothetical protein
MIDQAIDELMEAFGALELANEELISSFQPGDTDDDMLTDARWAAHRYLAALRLVRRYLGRKVATLAGAPRLVE